MNKYSIYLYIEVPMLYKKGERKMAIIFKPRVSCPICHTKIRAVKISPFLKVCPKCHSRVN